MLVSLQLEKQRLEICNESILNKESKHLLSVAILRKSEVYEKFHDRDAGKIISEDWELWRFCWIRLMMTLPYGWKSYILLFPIRSWRPVCSRKSVFPPTRSHGYWNIIVRYFVLVYSGRFLRKKVLRRHLWSLYQTFDYYIFIAVLAGLFSFLFSFIMWFVRYTGYFGGKKAWLWKV